MKKHKNYLYLEDLTTQEYKDLTEEEKRDCWEAYRIRAKQDRTAVIGFFILVILYCSLLAFLN